MTIITNFVKYCAAFDKINKINDEYFKHLDINTLANYYDKFSICQINNGRDDNWYLLYRKSDNSVVNWFKRLIFKTEYSFITNSDLGKFAGGEYDWIVTSYNPIYHLLYNIPNHYRAYLGNRNFISTFSKNKPRGKIIKKLNIENTLASINFDIVENSNLFDELIKNCDYTSLDKNHDDSFYREAVKRDGSIKMIDRNDKL